MSQEKKEAKIPSASDKKKHEIPKDQLPPECPVCGGSKTNPSNGNACFCSVSEGR